MDVDRRRQLHRDELLELAELVGELDPDALARPTWCGDWRVADVITHVAGWERLLGYDHRRQHPARLAGLAATFLASRGSVDRLNERLLARPRRPSTSSPPARHVFDRLSPGAQLAELVIHHQDVRRALDRPRPIPPERLALALDGVFRLPLPATARLRRHRLAATDLDWARGDGPLVEGPAESLLLAIAGRPVDGELARS